ncbi:MAG: glycosyl hydrolase [Bacteroidetes bacterium]|nr:glycosyl hydrolase [Bacteroidota bacterium]
MKIKNLLSLAALLIGASACQQEGELGMQVIQSSASGDRLKEVPTKSQNGDYLIQIDTSISYQEIEGFGGAITESSAHLLQHLPVEKQQEVLAAYFSDSAAAYNIVRLHINSCDFSLSKYAYVDSGDTNLSSFSIAPDKDDIIPIAKKALALAGEDLRFFASPWTAPPYMKDNQDWYGGKLLPAYYDLWARYFVKYAQSYEKEGLPIWGFTVENEPLGNDANWESMHFTPSEMASFISNNLVPQLAAAEMPQKIFIYDQNRGEELEEWADLMIKDPQVRESVYGTAVHWYTSTFKWFPESLQHTHQLAPEKKIWNTEACVDAEVPHWQDDAWYWKKEATDWGYTWAKEEDKPDHPKYVPVYRYARDIIGCLNNQVSAWVDWNIVLDREGGPNHASNWCVAPVIADTTAGEVYFTPLYDALRHFSHFIERGAQRLEFNGELPEGLHLTVVQNPNGEIVIPVLNTSEESLSLTYQIGAEKLQCQIPSAALQTIVISPKD